MNDDGIVNKERRQSEIMARIVGSAISDDGETVILARMDHTLVRWNPAKRGASERLTETPSPITALALSSDGHRMAFAWSNSKSPVQDDVGGSTNATLAVWMLVPTVRELVRINTEITPTRLVFTPQADRLLVMQRVVTHAKLNCTGGVKLWDLRSSDLGTNIAPCSPEARFFPDGDRLVAYSAADDRLRVMGQDGTIRATSTPLGQVLSLAVSPDGSRVAARTTLGVELLEAKSLQRYLTISSSTRGPSRMRFSADGIRLVILERGLVRALEARSTYDPQVRTMVRQLLFDSPHFFSLELSGVFTRERPLWVYDVERRVRRDVNIAPEMQRAIIDELRRIGDGDVVALCNDAAEISVRRDASTEEYQRGLRNAERATQLAPWSAFCTGRLEWPSTRVQDYEGALEALDRARQIRARPLPSELAVQAMALQRLGRTAEALVVARQLWTAPNRSEGEMTTLMAELESVVSGGRPTPPAAR